MRRRKNKLEKINKSILIIGIIFIFSIVVGSFLNKIWPSYQKEIFLNISPMIDYYGSNLNLKSNVINNLKSDFLLIFIMSLSTLFVFTFPIAMILFIIKGISIGYTINSIILALKIKSIKMILVTFSKNIIVIPGTIILLIIGINYAKEVLFQKKKNILPLFNRHILNMLLLIFGTIFVQAIINFLITSLMKMLA